MRNQRRKLVHPTTAICISHTYFHTGPKTTSHHAGPYSSSSDSNSTTPARKPVTLLDIRKLYKQQKPIAVLTAHDYISGKIADQAGVDIVLVGDSLAMVALGYDNTNEIELEDMIHHARSARRGVKTAFLAADLPFGSYESSPEQALDSAMQMVKRGRVDAVKIEGGVEYTSTIQKLTSRGIPVIGHVGLTPQRQTMLGGFRVQGKTAESAESVLIDALALQNAGCFALVLEAVPAPIGELITTQLNIPIIGIGAGPGTSGQVLVQLDMLGGFDGFTPKFLKKYSTYLSTNVQACAQYVEEVQTGVFPESKHCYPVSDAELEKFQHILSSKYTKTLK